MTFDELMEDPPFVCRHCGCEIDERDHGLCESCRQEMLHDYFEGDGDDVVQMDLFDDGFTVLDDWEPLP